MNGLILVPTQLELDHLSDEFRGTADSHDWSIELCGFGPIASAARSASLIEQKKPSYVLLLGIAGGYQLNADLGSAYAFERVYCYGVGAGVGEDYQAAGDIGLPHWKSGGQTIGDSLGLYVPPWETELSSLHALLTTPSASANMQEARQKLAAVQDAMAEDMEGFSVAVSCKLANVPLTIIRGISNRAGDRDHTNWRIGEAISAAEKLATEKLITKLIS